MPEDLKPKDRTNEFSQFDIEKNKGIAGISYLWILFFLPLVVCPDSEYGRFHANQALVLFLVETIMGSVVAFSSRMPFVGWSVGIILGLADVVFAIVAILELIYTLQGKAYEIPILGTIKLIK